MTDTHPVGSITERPWGTILSGPKLAPVIALDLANLGYLALRANKAGVDQLPIFRTFAYLFLGRLGGLFGGSGG